MKKLYFLVVMMVMGSVNAQNPDDIVYIPDELFKTSLLNSSQFAVYAKDVNGNYITIDVNNDLEIQVSEALLVVDLQIEYKSIDSFEGIEAFSNLKRLALIGTSSEIIDCTELVNLEQLIVNIGPTTNIIVSGLTNLKELDCRSNQIPSLDLSGTPNLEHLMCAENLLTSLDVSMLSNLKTLAFAVNEITNLNINGLENLEIFDCQENQLTALDLTANQNLHTLFCGSNPIQTLNVAGLSNLTQLSLTDCPVSTLETSELVSLVDLYLENANLTSLDVSGFTALERLHCGNNNITNLNVSGATSMVELFCEQNQITSLDLTGMHALSRLKCHTNQLTTLDLSDLHSLNEMWTYSNLLQTMLIKNGASYGMFSISNNPNLIYICADEGKVAGWQQKVTQLGYNCVVNSYCSFTPGGQFYIVNGTNKFDSNNNGCNVSDPSFANLKFTVTTGTQLQSIISNQTGSYSTPVLEGTHTIVPVLENPNFFTISPATVSVTFPEATSPFTQNFCITPNGLHPDLEVAILPTTPARPGFDAEYKLIIKNKGNIQQSGSVSFTYNDAILDYIIAAPLFTTQAEGSLSWDFANLEPFETREINVTLNVNSPMETPAVNGDDILTYTATITSEATDELPLDNTFTLPQIVVNSFDPNDKTCLEGTAITPDMIGKYVHYMIRFENTGTFAAENIVVKDMIDTAKFDVSSLVALNGSHPFVTRITGNKVEFIFENINLPFEDATNDGYVVFKIKTLPTLALGDSFSNTASIYFDFNHPIVTEPAVTTFAVLGTEDFVFNSYFTLYPNPTNGILNITSKQAIELQSISIYNVLGQMVVSVPNAKGVNNVDVSNLSTGNYFIKVVSDKGTSNAKFIKK